MTKLVTLALASALALASCTTTDAITSSTEQSVDSGITVQLWDPGKDNNTSAFWASSSSISFVPVASMQYLVQKGDAGGSLTRGFPTVYVWLVADANKVHKVWRVAKDQYDDFVNDMRARQGAVLASHPGLFAGGAGSPDGGDLGHVPHIGPHGDGASNFSTVITGAAVAAAAQVKTLWTNPQATGFADIAAGETSGW